MMGSRMMRIPSMFLALMILLPVFVAKPSLDNVGVRSKLPTAHNFLVPPIEFLSKQDVSAPNDLDN
jgi:hypothetical protein